MWKPIERFNGKFEVSDEGEIRSNLRDGRILKAQKDHKGYLRMRLSYEGAKYSIRPHREVAIAFIPNPNNLPQVNHIDGNKENNKLENLEWVDNHTNADHAMATGLWANVLEASRRANNARKTPIFSVDIHTNEKRYFESVSEAERYFDSRHISDVLNGKRNTAAGQKFYRGGDEAACRGILN